MANPGDFLSFWENALANLLGPSAREPEAPPEPYIPDVPPTEYIAPAVSYDYYRSDTPLPADYSVYETPPEFEEMPVPDIAPHEDEPRRTFWTDYLDRLLAPSYTPQPETIPPDISMPTPEYPEGPLIPVPEGETPKLPNLLDVPEQYRDTYLWLANLDRGSHTIPEEHSKNIRWLAETYPAIKQATGLDLPEPDMPQVETDSTLIEQTAQKNPYWYENFSIPDLFDRSIKSGQAMMKNLVGAAAVPATQINWVAPFLPQPVLAWTMGKAVAETMLSNLYRQEPERFTPEMVRALKTNPVTANLAIPNDPDADDVAKRITDSTDFGTHWAAAVAGVMEMPEVIAQSETARALRERGYQAQIQGKAEYQQTPLEAPEVPEDIANIEQTGKWLAAQAPRTIIGSMPLIIPGLVATFGLGALGSLLGPGGTAGGIAVGGVLSGVGESLLESGASYAEARDKGMSDEEALRVGTKTYLANLPLTVGLNVVGSLNLFGNMAKAAGRMGKAGRAGIEAAAAAENMSKPAKYVEMLQVADRLASKAPAMVRQLPVEMAQEVSQTMAARWASDDPDPFRLDKEVLGAALGAAMIVPVMGGVAGAIQLGTLGLNIKAQDPDANLRDYIQAAIQLHERKEQQYQNGELLIYAPKSLVVLADDIAIKDKHKIFSGDVQNNAAIRKAVFDKALGFIAGSPVDIATLPDQEYVRLRGIHDLHVNESPSDLDADQWLKDRDATVRAAQWGDVGPPLEIKDIHAQTRDVRDFTRQFVDDLRVETGAVAPLSTSLPQLAVKIAGEILKSPTTKQQFSIVSVTPAVAHKAIYDAILHDDIASPDYLDEYYVDERAWLEKGPGIEPTQEEASAWIKERWDLVNAAKAQQDAYFPFVPTHATPPWRPSPPGPSSRIVSDAEIRAETARITGQAEEAQKALLPSPEPADIEQAKAAIPKIVQLATGMRDKLRQAIPIKDFIDRIVTSPTIFNLGRPLSKINPAILVKLAYDVALGTDISSISAEEITDRTRQFTDSDKYSIITAAPHISALIQGLQSSQNALTQLGIPLGTTPVAPNVPEGLGPPVKQGEAIFNILVADPEPKIVWHNIIIPEYTHYFNRPVLASQLRDEYNSYRNAINPARRAELDNDRVIAAVPKGGIIDFLGSPIVTDAEPGTVVDLGSVKEFKERYEQVSAVSTALQPYELDDIGLADPRLRVRTILRIGGVPPPKIDSVISVLEGVDAFSAAVGKTQFTDLLGPLLGDIQKGGSIADLAWRDLWLARNDYPQLWTLSNQELMNVSEAKVHGQSTDPRKQIYGTLNSILRSTGQISEPKRQYKRKPEKVIAEVREVPIPTQLSAREQAEIKKPAGPTVASVPQPPADIDDIIARLRRMAEGKKWTKQEGEAPATGVPEPGPKPTGDVVSQFNAALANITKGDNTQTEAIKTILGRLAAYAGFSDLDNMLRQRVAWIETEVSGGAAQEGLESKSLRGGIMRIVDDVTRKAHFALGLFRGKSDISTPLHEAAHMLIQDMPVADRMAAAQVYGVTDDGEKVGLDNWYNTEQGEQAQEQFARDFEKYFVDGQMPEVADADLRQKLRTAFENLKKWLLQIYRDIKRYFGENEIHPDIRAIFDKIIAGKPTIQAEVIIEPVTETIPAVEAVPSAGLTAQPSIRLLKIGDIVEHDQFKAGGKETFRKAIVDMVAGNEQEKTVQADAILSILDTIARNYWGTNLPTFLRQSVGQIRKAKVVPAKARDKLLQGPIEEGRPRGETADAAEVAGRIVYLLADADISTILHESGHLIFGLLKPEDLRVSAEYYGEDITKGYAEWAPEGRERFAKDFERYFLEGKAPPAAGKPLKRLFETIKQALITIYQNVQAYFGDNPTYINPAIRKVFNKLLTGKPYDPALADAAVYVQQLRQNPYLGDEFLRDLIQELGGTAFAARRDTKYVSDLVHDLLTHKRIAASINTWAALTEQQGQAFHKVYEELRNKYLKADIGKADKDWGTPDPVNMPRIEKSPAIFYVAPSDMARMAREGKDQFRITYNMQGKSPSPPNLTPDQVYQYIVQFMIDYVEPPARRKFLEAIIQYKVPTESNAYGKGVPKQIAVTDLAGNKLDPIMLEDSDYTDLRGYKESDKKRENPHTPAKFMDHLETWFPGTKARLRERAETIVKGFRDDYPQDAKARAIVDPVLSKLRPFISAEEVKLHNHTPATEYSIGQQQVSDLRDAILALPDHPALAGIDPRQLDKDVRAVVETIFPNPDIAASEVGYNKSVANIASFVGVQQAIYQAIKDGELKIPVTGPTPVLVTTRTKEELAGMSVRERWTVDRATPTVDAAPLSSEQRAERRIQEDNRKSLLLTLAKYMDILIKEPTDSDPYFVTLLKKNRPFKPLYKEMMKANIVLALARGDLNGMEAFDALGVLFERDVRMGDFAFVMQHIVNEGRVPDYDHYYWKSTEDGPWQIEIAAVPLNQDIDNLKRAGLDNLAARLEFFKGLSKVLNITFDPSRESIVKLMQYLTEKGLVEKAPRYLDNAAAAKIRSYLQEQGENVIPLDKLIIFENTLSVGELIRPTEYLRMAAHMMVPDLIHATTATPLDYGMMNNEKRFAGWKVILDEGISDPGAWLGKKVNKYWLKVLDGAYSAWAYVENIERKTPDHEAHASYWLRLAELAADQSDAAANRTLQRIAEEDGITDEKMHKWLSAYLAEQSDYEKFIKFLQMQKREQFKGKLKAASAAMKHGKKLLEAAGIERPEIASGKDIRKYLDQLDSAVRADVEKKIADDIRTLEQLYRDQPVKPLLRPYGVDMSPEVHYITLAKIRQAAGEEGYARLESAATKVNAYYKYRLGDIYNAGIIDSSLYAELYDHWHHWSPDILVDMISEEQLIGERKMAEQVGLTATVINKLIGGTERAAYDPMHSFVLYSRKMWLAVLRNQAALALVQNFTDAKIPIRRIDPNERLSDKDEVAFSVFEKGKMRRYAVATIYGRMLFADVSSTAQFIIGAGKLLARPLKFTATQRNPMFVMKNIIIDFLAAMVKEGITPIDWGKAFVKVMTDPDYVASLMSRGLISKGGFYRPPTEVFTERAERARALEQAVREAMMGEWYKVDTSKKWLKLVRDIATLKWVEEIGTLGEIVPRAATFERYMKGETLYVDPLIAERGGLSEFRPAVRGEIRALFRGKEVTMDFGYLGRGVKVLNTVLPYFGVAVQSPLQIIRTFTRAASWQETCLRVFSYVIFPSIMITLWNNMGDNRKKYEQIPDYVKQRSWPIILPFKEWWYDKGGNPIPPYVEIPLRDWAPFALLTTIGVENGLKLDPYAWMNITRSMFTYWSPVQDTMSLLPPLFQGLIEASGNRNWFTDRHLVPIEMEHLPAAEQYTGKESYLSIMMGKMLGQSPIIMDHLLTSNFGGLGDIVIGALSGGLVALQQGEYEKTRMKPGDHLWGHWVWADGTVDKLLKNEEEIPGLRGMALAGQGQLYVVAASDKPTAQNRLGKGLYVDVVGAHQYAGDIPLIGGLIRSLGYRERGGGLAARAAMAMDTVGGAGTAEHTTAAWAQLRAGDKYRETLDREEKLWAAMEGKTGKPISGREFQDNYRKIQADRASQIEGAQQAHPLAAMTGERARTISDAAATLLGTAQDNRERGEILAAAWYAISPKIDENGLDDMPGFFKERDQFLESLPADDRLLLEQYKAPQTAIRAEFEAARKVIADIVSLDRYAKETGVGKEEGDAIYAAGRLLGMYVDRLDPSITNKQTVALYQMSKDAKAGTIDSKAAERATKYITLRNSLNPAIKELRQKHMALLQKFYGDTATGGFADITAEPAGAVPVTTGITAPPVAPVGMAPPVAETREGDKQTIIDVVDKAPKYTPNVTKGWEEYNAIPSTEKLDWQKKHTAIYKLMSTQKKAKDAYAAENPLYRDYIKYIKSQAPDLEDADLEGTVSDIDAKAGIDSVGLFMVNLSARGRTVQGTIAKGKETVAGKPTETAEVLEAEARAKLYPNLQGQSMQLETLFNEMPKFSPDVRAAWARYNMLSTQQKTNFRNANKALYNQMQQEDSARDSYINHNPALKQFIAYAKREYDLSDEDLLEMEHIDDLDLKARVQSASDFILYLTRTGKDIETLYSRARTVPEPTPPVTVATTGGGGARTTTTAARRTATTTKVTAPKKTAYQMIMEILARKGKLGVAAPAATKAAITAALPKAKKGAAMQRLLILWNLFRKKGGLAPFKSVDDMIRAMVNESEETRKQWAALISTVIT